MYRVLFHMDSDGHSSAGVVAKYLKEKGVPASQIYFHAVNYGLPLPTEIDYEKDTIYMVDFSLQPDLTMIDFAAKLGERFIWIDHHDTSVKMEERVSALQRIPGRRQVEDINGVKIAGCELTWKCFYGKKEMPQILKMIGDWDTWRWTELPKAEQESVRHLQSYLLNNITSPQHKDGRAFWEVELEKEEVNPKYLREGQLVWEYQKKQWRSMAKSHAFEAEFAGLRAIMLNAKGSSDMFEGVFDPERHDLMVTFQLTREQYLVVSMYRGSSQCNVHLGDLAANLGRAGDIQSGGGHAGAAGFQCGWDYFKTLYNVL